MRRHREALPAMGHAIVHEEDGGLLLVDQDQVGVDLQNRGADIMVEVLGEQLIARYRPTAELCSMQQPAHEDTLFKAARSVNPGITYSEFLAEAGDAIVRDDSDQDPRLPVKIFLVFGPGMELLGNWTLYNIHLERDDAEKIVATAMPMPGCRPLPGRTIRETWSEVMRWILENDFDMDGIPVDFIAWRFPTRESHQWCLSDAELAASGLGEEHTPVSIYRTEIDGVKVGLRRPVADIDDHDLTVNARGAPIEIRRSAHHS